MRPKVSVIVPVYNVEKYLDRCVESLQNQSLEEIEIILVDDGSPDKCPELCDGYAKKDSRISVIHKENGGLGYARNSGLKIATGEYVAFVDSDDYVSLDAFEKLYTEAKKEKAEICFGGFFLVGSDNNIEIRQDHPYAETVFQGNEIVDIVLYNMLGSDESSSKDVNIRQSVWQGIYSLSWLREHNVEFKSERIFISEDIIFHIDALPKANKMKFIRGCYYYHIVDNPTSLTHKYNPTRFERCKNLYLEEKLRIEELNISFDAISRIQRAFIGNTRVTIQQILHHAKEQKDASIKKNVDVILNNYDLSKVLTEYSYKENPWKQRIFTLLMRRKNRFLIEVMVVLNNLHRRV